MTARSTTRVQRPARRPRPARRARQSLAVTMMVVGLVVGAFAAPSMAEDQAATTQAVAPAPDLVENALDDPPIGPGEDNGNENPGGGGTPGPDVVPCDLGVDFNGPDEDGCGEPNGDQCVPADYNGEAPGCGTPPVIVEPCLDGVDYNGPLQDGCGTDPNSGNNGGGNPPGNNNGGGTPGNNNGGGTPGNNNGGGTPGNNNGGGTPSNGGSTPSNGVGGTTGGGGNPSLGTTLGVAEGSVPGSEGAAAVTSCSDSVICQSAPAATSTGSSVEGLPETGAPADSGQLLAVGVGLLLAGGLLLKPGRRGRHRLVAA